ncbi:MAG: 4Fe-4S dicluster domain-containing protein, partial [Anaerolineae bacterium]
MRFSRRDFLKLSAAGASGLLLTEASREKAFAAPTQKAISYDASKCIGCRACQMACKRWNELPAESEGPYDIPLRLSANTWTMIRLSKRSEEDWHFFNYQCMHCTDAACVTVCPSGALYKNELGFTAVDQTKCIGCGYCTQYCPYDVPHLNMQSPLITKAKVAKCTFCQDRIAAGIGGPFCAETCPVGALVWDNRAELLEKAKERVDYLHSQGQTEARLYGENEAGGLHRLSIIFGEPSRYRLPEKILYPALATVWQDIVQPLGELAIWATAVGLLINFLIARRNIKVEERQMERKEKPILFFTTTQRFVHWLHTVAFLLLLVTGMVLYVPQLHPFAVGSPGQASRLLHRIGAILLAAVPVIYIIFDPRRFAQSMKEIFTWSGEDVGWLRAAPGYYFFGDEEAMPPQKKFNTGQKLFYLTVAIAMLVFGVTGFIMWFGKGVVPVSLFQWSVFLH